MDLSNTLADKKGPLGNKVPEVTVLFWIIKILTTGMGEVMADFLIKLGVPNLTEESVATLSSAQFTHILLIALSIFGLVSVCLVIAMVLQISSRHYVTWKYWLNVIAVAIFGTMAADFVQIGYLASTSVYLVILAIILTLWFVKEKTLSVHSIDTRRRELFYWATVLATFAMGTALGDLTAKTFHLGYLTSGLMFICIFAVPTIAFKFFHANEVFCFWFAYITTRPLGASFADWMADDKEGLGWGQDYVTLVLTVIIIALVIYMTVKDNKKNAAKSEPSAMPEA